MDERYVSADRNSEGVQVVCLGETMLMFAPPRYELIEYSDQFTVYNGGSESNVAIGLERLGVHSGWVSKIPTNPLGRKVVNEIRAFGVDTRACIWTDTGRVGTFFVEWGAHPRPLRTIYDRSGSAMTTLTVEELDWDYLGRASWLHLTGITPALSETCRQAVPQIVLRARECGCRVSFDVNYRSLLWTPAEARAACREILPQVNLVIATESDAQMLLAGQYAREGLLERLFASYQPEMVVMTCGPDGSMAFDGNHTYCSPGYEAQVVNRLGAGDAFDAGLLYGLIKADLQTGLDYGGAMAALKLTIPQNIPLIEPQDVERLLAGKDWILVR